ncbi:MAG: Gfo/Idh/MocA family protein [Armatimonadota bacterium]
MGLRIGIAGAGNTGFLRTHQLKVYDDIQVTAVADPVRPVRDGFVRTFGTKLAVSDHRRMVADPSVDAVWICSPPSTHSAIAIDALNSGKDVICEQPIAVNMRQADEMIEAAEKSGHRLLINLPHRYDPAYQEAARLIDADEIGYPFLTLCSFADNEFDRLNNWHDWKGTWDVGGGGVLMEHGSEMIDLLRYMLGQVDAVNAVCTRFVIEPLNKAEDSCLLSLEFMEESTAELALTGAARYHTRPSDNARTGSRFEIFGLDGSILVSSAEPRLTITSKNIKYQAFNTSEINTDLPTDMVRDFLDCILLDKVPLVTMDDAREALRIVLAGYKSSQMKRRVEILEQL